jgi:hypothetical protein
MRKRRALGGAIAAVAAVCGGSSRGQSDELADISRLDCRFAAVVTGTWNDGGETSAAVAPATLELSFDQIDARQGTAESTTRFGASYIIARLAGDYLHLIQMIDIGPLYVTTVIAGEMPDGRLRAVHTRHEFAASSYPEFRERPKLYLGDCVAGRD